MRPLDYLRILGRRWWILVVGALIGSLLAFATQPSPDSLLLATAPKVQFRATTRLLADAGSTEAGLARVVGYDRLALITIEGPVADAAMKKLGASLYSVISDDRSSDSSTDSEQNSQQRARQKSIDPLRPDFKSGKGAITLITKEYGYTSVAAVPDPATGTLSIVATGGRTASPLFANTFARELISYLDQLGVTRYNNDVARFDRARLLAEAQAAGLALQAAAPGVDPLLAGSLFQRRVEILRRIDEIDADEATLKQSGAAKSQLQSMREASEDRLTLIRAPGGTAVSPSQRLVVGGAVGFFLSLAMLIVMELLGARIRDVAGTEGAARMPVIAEIPVVNMNRADRFVVATASDPSSLTAEAYRSLRTSLLAMWQRHPKNVPLRSNGNGNGNGGGNGSGNGNGSPAHGRPLRTLLVTSPGPAEGKSITVVNLAAAFAETGITVIVLDADFRRPTQTRYLERPRNPNLGDLDLTCTPEDLEAVLQDTDVPGVRLAASAPSKSDPGHAIAVAKAAVHAAEQLADIVIIDSPPLLLANDASDLALSVDASILLARSGWTRRNGIVASADLMRRLEATVIGVVIVGAEHGARAGYYGYYGYYGYGYGYAHPGEVSIMKRLLPWKAARKAPAKTPGKAPAKTPGKAAAPVGSRPTADIVPPRPTATPPAPPAPDADDTWV